MAIYQGPLPCEALPVNEEALTLQEIDAVYSYAIAARIAIAGIGKNSPRKEAQPLHNEDNISRNIGIILDNDLLDEIKLIVLGRREIK